MEITGEELLKSSDEALCRAAAAGSDGAEEALVLRYNRLVRACARPYFLLGGDSEDLLQEGMIGLVSAIRNFKPGENASFRTFAAHCIRNRLLTAVKAAQSDKRAPLNRSIPFDTPFLDSLSDESLGFLRANPEDLMIDREAVQECRASWKGLLSGFETKVLALYLGGLSYSEIAVRLGRSAKSVDNAVQRIRRKVAQHFHSGEFSKS